MAENARSDRRPPPVDTSRRVQHPALVDVALSPVATPQGGRERDIEANLPDSPAARPAPLESRNAYGITNRLSWTSWAYLALLVLIFVYWWVVVDFLTALVLPFLLLPLAIVLVWWFRNRHITPLDAVVSCFARGFSPYGVLTFMFEVAVGLFTTLFTGHFLSLPQADTVLAVFIFAIWGALATFEEYIKYRLVLQTEQSPALRSPPGKEKLIISTAQTTGFACGLTIFACLLYSIIRTAFVDSVSKTPGEPTVARHSQASAVFALAGVLTVISVPVHCLTGYLISLRVVLRDQYPPHGADVASAAAAVVQPSPSSQYIPDNAPAPDAAAAPTPAFGAAGSGALPPQAGSAASAPAPAAPAAGAAVPAPGAAAAADELVVVAREHHLQPRTPQIPAANVSTLPPPEERRGTAKILLLPSVLRSLLMLHILLALSGAYGTVGSPLFFVALVLPALLVAAVLMGVVRATEKQLPPDYLRRVGSLTFTYARLLGDEESAADLPPYSPGFVELARAERRRADEARSHALQQERGMIPLPLPPPPPGPGQEHGQGQGQGSSSLSRAIDV